MQQMQLMLLIPTNAYVDLNANNKAHAAGANAKFNVDATANVSKAKQEQAAKKAAKKAQVESENVAADLKELRQVKIKSTALMTFIAELTAKYSHHAQANPGVKAPKNKTCTFKVTGENKITIFAKLDVDSEKVGSSDAGANFNVIEQKACASGRTYLHLEDGRG